MRPSPLANSRYALFRKVDDWLRKVYTKRPIRFSLAAAILPVAITVGVAMMGPSELVGYLRICYSGCYFSWTGAWKVGLLGLLLLAFVLVQYTRIREDRFDAFQYRMNQSEQLQGLAVMPNLGFLLRTGTDHQDLIAQAISKYFDRHRTIDLATASEQIVRKELKAVTADLQLALRSLAALARQYGMTAQSPVYDARYGASIMLIVPKTDIPHLPKRFRTEFAEQGLLHFAGDRPDILRLDGILILTKDLISDAQLDGAPDVPKEQVPTKPPYPELSLPVRFEPSKIILPGAPEAIANGQVSLHLDTAQMVAEYGARFSEPTRRELERYFGHNGGGGSVKSFISLRIGTEQAPLGVLSFDADITAFLGDKSTHYTTFATIMLPLLYVLRPAVGWYTRLWWQLNREGI